MLLLPTSAAHSLEAILSESDAASGDTSSLGIAAESLVMAIVFLTIGALAFSGLWRWWARWKPPMLSIYYFPYLPLGIGWMGVGLVVMAAGLFLPRAIEMPVIYIGLAISFFGLVGFVFMPRALLPRWYRAAKGLARGASDASSGAAVTRDSSKVQAAAERAAQDAASPKGGRGDFSVDDDEQDIRVGRLTDSSRGCGTPSARVR
ncbi:hypothetical protein [Clavibacter michiganensis]|uniref:hypothetical protein n=1 Tax=Clavibacter michiganensis TaxID=28447 RepID=UPI000A3789EB|nr:hypothetical protein [Clavibacter michiganensis]